MFGPTVWRLGRIADPFADIRRLQSEMNSLFSGIGTRSGHDYPAINILLNEQNAIVTAELPGLNPDETDISVTGDVLTVSGSRSQESLKEGEVYHRQERILGKFTRTLQLPFNVDAGEVDAKYEKGVLKITLPRAEEDKPRKISIKSE